MNENIENLFKSVSQKFILHPFSLLFLKSDQSLYSNRQRYFCKLSQENPNNVLPQELRLVLLQPLDVKISLEFASLGLMARPGDQVLQRRGLNALEDDLYKEKLRNHCRLSHPCLQALQDYESPCLQVWEDN